MRERQMHARQRRVLAVATTAATAGLAVAGCGGGDETYANRPRPPAPINVVASISNEGVAVSPRRFGAGPINVLVTNQTGAAQRLTLESVDEIGEGPGISQETSPINPRDTARLSADVDPGKYRLHVDTNDIRGARLVVGPQRRSAQDELLLP
jgi:hypothetical protein